MRIQRKVFTFELIKFFTTDKDQRNTSALSCQNLRFLENTSRKSGSWEWKRRKPSEARSFANYFSRHDTRVEFSCSCLLVICILSSLLDFNELLLLVSFFAFIFQWNSIHSFSCSDFKFKLLTRICTKMPNQYRSKMQYSSFFERWPVDFVLKSSTWFSTINYT